MSKENDLLWLEITSQPPYRKDIVSDPMFAPYFKKNPMMSKFVVAGCLHPRVDDSKHLIEIFDAISKQYDLWLCERAQDSERTQFETPRGTPATFWQGGSGGKWLIEV